MRVKLAIAAAALMVFAFGASAECFLKDPHICFAEGFLKGIGLGDLGPTHSYESPSQAEAKAAVLAHGFDPWVCTKVEESQGYTAISCKTQRKTTKLELQFDLSGDHLNAEILTMKSWNGDSVYCGRIDDADCF